MNGLYKYIVKNGNGFKIQKDNEAFGTYSSLTDALYERDRLVKANWDWDDALQLEETDNFYEDMTLPKFVHEYSYVSRIVQKYNVYKDGKYYCSFRNKTKAFDYAESIGGEVVESNITYRIIKRIKGKQVYFGQYPTLEEAKKKRDELIKNGWKT